MSARLQARPRSFWEQLWATASDARTAGAALVAAAVFAALNDVRIDRTLDPAVRFFAGAAAASAMLVASRLLLALSGAPERKQDGAALLGALADTDLRAGGTRAAIAAVALVWLVGVVPAMALFASAAPLSAVGQLQLTERETADRFEMYAPLELTWHTLGARVTLESVVDGVARVRVSNAAETLNVERDMELGDALRLGDHRLVLHATSVTAAPTAASLRVAARTGGEAADITVPVGGRSELPGGGVIEVVAAEADVLGQLGPAVEVREWEDGVPGVSSWLYARAPAFDVRHGVGRYQVELLGLVPAQRATFAVSTSPLAGTVATPWVGCWAALVLAVWFVGRRGGAPVVAGHRGRFALSLDPFALRDAGLPGRPAIAACVTSALGAGAAGFSGHAVTAVALSGAAGFALAAPRHAVAGALSLVIVAASHFGVGSASVEGLVVYLVAALLGGWGVARCWSSATSAQLGVGFVAGAWCGWLAAWSRLPGFVIEGSRSVSGVEVSVDGMAYASSPWISTSLPWVALVAFAAGAVALLRGNRRLLVGSVAVAVSLAGAGAAGLLPGDTRVRGVSGDLSASLDLVAPTVAWSAPVAASLVGVAVVLMALATHPAARSATHRYAGAFAVVVGGALVAVSALESGQTMHEASSAVLLLPAGVGLLGLAALDRTGRSTAVLAAAIFGAVVAASGAWG